jgi:iron complex transport system substrate-binding protein
MEELADILGLENIFADTEGWAQVSEEQVINRDPDYIVTTTMSFEGAPDPVEEIKTRAGWENITAVTNGSIINDSSSMMVRPGPRLADAARALYNFVYGGQ